MIFMNVFQVEVEDNLVGWSSQLSLDFNAIVNLCFLFLKLKLPTLSSSCIASQALEFVTPSITRGLCMSPLVLSITKSTGQVITTFQLRKQMTTHN